MPVAAGDLHKIGEDVSKASTRCRASCVMVTRRPKLACRSWRRRERDEVAAGIYPGAGARALIEGGLPNRAARRRVVSVEGRDPPCRYIAWMSPAWPRSASRSEQPTLASWVGTADRALAPRTIIWSATLKAAECSVTSSLPGLRFPGPWTRQRRRHVAIRPRTRPVGSARPPAAAYT